MNILKFWGKIFFFLMLPTIFVLNLFLVNLCPACLSVWLSGWRSMPDMSVSLKCELICSFKDFKHK